MSAPPPPPEPPEGPPASATDTALERLRNARNAKRDARVGTKGERPRSSIGLGAVLIVILVAVGAWFLLQKMREMGRIQDCVQQGRKNCDHVDDPNER
jgi:hypothetical protein